MNFVPVSSQHYSICIIIISSNGIHDTKNGSLIFHEDVCQFLATALTVVKLTQHTDTIPINCVCYAAMRIDVTAHRCEQ